MSEASGLALKGSCCQRVKNVLLIHYPLSASHQVLGCFPQAVSVIYSQLSEALICHPRGKGLGQIRVGESEEARGGAGPPSGT